MLTIVSMEGLLSKDQETAGLTLLVLLEALDDKYLHITQYPWFIQRKIDIYKTDKSGLRRFILKSDQENKLKSHI